MSIQIAVIIPAAGSGNRFAQASDGLATEQNKLELDLVGRPVFLRSVELFLNRPQIIQIILAVNPTQLDTFNFKYGDKLGFQGVKVVPGGEMERWQTVLNALEALKEECSHVAIHDAARPLASPVLIDRVFESAERFDAVVPGRPVNATLKKAAATAEDSESDADPLDDILGSAGKSVIEAKRVLETIDRTDVVEVQTPQIFERKLLRRAYDQIQQGTVDKKGITDDACLVEALGEPVYVVEGEAANLKITRPDDLKLAAAFLQAIEQKKAVSLGRKRLFADDD